MRKSIAVMLVGVALLSGCSYRIGDFTIGSTKNYNINSNQFVRGKRVTGEDFVPVIFLPIGFPNVKDAVDMAIEHDRCAVAMSDLVVTEHVQSFLFGRIGIRVEGDLVIDRSQPGCGGRA